MHSEAAQVFLGTLPLTLAVIALFFREQMLLKDILERLKAVQEWMPKIEHRLTVLETRAGVIYHE
jgi:hypothetical protein